MTFESSEIKQIEYDLWRGVMVIVFKNNKRKKIKTSWDNYVDFIQEWTNSINF